MSESTELQNLIAAAWDAGYAARETELICRRRSSLAQREAEIAKVIRKMIGSLQETSRAVGQQEIGLTH